MRKFTYTNPNGDSIILWQTPYLVESVEGTGSPATDIQSQKAPYQDGVTFIDTLYQPRTITIQGAINNPQDWTDIYTRRREMVRILNPKLGPGTLRYDFDTDAFQITAIPDGSPVFPNKEWTNPFQKYQISFFCPDPYWQDITSGTLALGLVDKLLIFPVTFPATFSERTGSNTGNIVNNGDYTSPALMTIYGPATNPGIRNNTTGEFIRIIRTLIQGESVIINTSFGNRTITISGVNGIQYLDLNSTFWQLGVGTNNIEVYDDAGFLYGSATIVWKDRFLGV